MDATKISSLNILFVQEAPCIRNYKMATALRGRGHQVTLGYTKGRLSQMYPGLSDDVYTRCVHIQNIRHLWDISKEFHLVHCHNEPDILSVSALAGDAPVIHDTHDLISLRAGGDANLSFFEGVANRGAHGRVYTTPYQQEEARNLYGVEGPSLVLYNYVSQADLPKRFLPKLSARDGRVHIVYEGGMGGTAHRDFIQLFVDLACRGIQVHMYPARLDQRMADFFASVPNTHYHGPVSPHEIMEVMTQYDIGIIPFNLEKGNKRFLDSTIANKLFEYLAAGLPVVTSTLRSYIDYFAKTPVGRTYQNVEDLLNGLPQLLKLSRDQDLRPYARTYEDEIGHLEAFYHQIIQAGPIRQPVRFMTPQRRERRIYYSKPVSHIIAQSAEGPGLRQKAEAENVPVSNRPQPGGLTPPLVERSE